MLTRTEAALVEAYERTARARAEFVKVPCWNWAIVVTPGLDWFLVPGPCTVMDEQEIRALRRLLEAFLVAEDRLRDHVLEHGPVEAAGVVYRLDGDRRLTRRRAPRWDAAPTRSIH